MTTPAAVEALARAIDAADLLQRPDLGNLPIPSDDAATRLLAALSYADRLAIAGITGMDGDHSDPRYRPLMFAVMEADEAFQRAGDAGTKTWLDDYFLPELEKHGLTLAALEVPRPRKPR